LNGIRKLETLLLAVLAVATPLTGGCHEPEPPKESRIHVEVGPPQVQDVDVSLRYPVELQADETVSITPVAISGFLRRVLVDVGDKVKGGQLIALVDCREYKAKRTQAETVIAKRTAQVEESRSQLERLERMGETLVAAAEIDRAEAEARVAEAELADAKAKLSEAGQRQGYCSLTSPFSGYVSERFLDPGAMVSPGGRPVVNIVKTREVRVVASLIEADAPKIARGVEVDVVLNAFPDTVFRAEVSRVGRALDPSTRTLRVEMDIPNKTELLLPGMTGRASIVVDTRNEALLVPVTALLQLEDAAYIYVVHDQDGVPTAHRVEVELGVDLGDWVEVRKGLQPTDQVIMVGRELVGEGSMLTITESTDRPPAQTKSDPREEATPPVTGGDSSGGEPSGETDDDSDGDSDSDEPTDDDDDGEPTGDDDELSDDDEPPTKPKPKPSSRAKPSTAKPKPSTAKPKAEPTPGGSPDPDSPAGEGPDPQ